MERGRSIQFRSNLLTPRQPSSTVMPGTDVLLQVYCLAGSASCEAEAIGTALVRRHCPSATAGRSCSRRAHRRCSQARKRLSTRRSNMPASCAFSAIRYEVRMQHPRRNAAYRAGNSLVDRRILTSRRLAGEQVALLACYLRSSIGDGMPDLLLEFFSEEIPARMQARAAEDLRKLVTDRLVDAGLAYEGAKAFATPRRLALAVHGVPVQAARREGGEEGPARRRARGRDPGLPQGRRPQVDRAKPRSQPDKKGDFYVAVIEKPGRPAIEVIGEIVPEVVKSFPWPKSMRWGDGQSSSWVRPLHSIVATFGPETEEPDIVRVRGRRDCGRRRDVRPPLPGARRRSRCAGSTTTWPSSKRPRSCSIPSGARR